MDYNIKKKGKTIPVIRFEGAHRIFKDRGSHIFYTIDSQMVMRLSALRSGRPVPPRKTAGTHFC
jgi:hypothetical protein